MKFEFSAGGIVYQKKGRNYRFALILDSYNRWTFPKGHIERGEKPAIAAEREVSEEIGVQLKTITLLDKIDYWFKDNRVLVHKFVYFYLMEAPSTAKLKPQKGEIKEARWFLPKEALKVLDYKKDSQPLLEKAYQDLKIMIS